jgi:hypothetical protein
MGKKVFAKLGEIRSLLSGECESYGFNRQQLEICCVLGMSRLFVVSKSPNIKYILKSVSMVETFTPLVKRDTR